MNKWLYLRSRYGVRIRKKNWKNAKDLENRWSKELVACKTNKTNPPPKSENSYYFIELIKQFWMWARHVPPRSNTLSFCFCETRPRQTMLHWLWQQKGEIPKLVWSDQSWGLQMNIKINSYLGLDKNQSQILKYHLQRVALFSQGPK